MCAVRSTARGNVLQRIIDQEYAGKAQCNDHEEDEASPGAEISKPVIGNCRESGGYDTDAEQRWDSKIIFLCIGQHPSQGEYGKKEACREKIFG